MPRVIIGLCGHKQSGKSTAAEVLERCGFHRMSFSAPIKRMLSVLGAGALEKEEIDPILECRSYRRAMQTLGTEWGRQMMGPNIWVNAWIRACPKSENVVVDDVRFENEAQAIRDMGGIIVRVNRPGAVADGHASEQIDFDCDFAIENSAGLGALADAIERIYAKSSQP
jgi:hypothetical protein